MKFVKVSQLIGVWAQLALSYSVLALQGQENDGDIEFEAVPDSVKFNIRMRRSSAKDTNKAGVTFEERAALIRAHNQFRSQVSPPADNMEFMTWDWDIAAMAQDWANTCQWKHGGLDTAGTPYQFIGQNLWMTTGGFDENTAVKKWDDEKADYTLDSHTCASGKVCGHYTQLAWAKSNKLGCGIKYCGSISGLSSGGYVLVCHYGPGGNMQGEKPYTTSGGSCSACPQSKSTCENNLCREATKCGGKVCEKAGELQEDTCECKCPEGTTWTGPTCNIESGGTRRLGNDLIVVAVLLTTILITYFE